MVAHRPQRFLGRWALRSFLLRMGAWGSGMVGGVGIEANWSWVTRLRWRCWGFCPDDHFYNGARDGMFGLNTRHFEAQPPAFVNVALVGLAGSGAASLCRRAAKMLLIRARERIVKGVPGCTPASSRR